VAVVVLISQTVVMAALVAAVEGSSLPVRGPAVKDTMEGTTILRTLSPALALALAAEPLLWVVTGQALLAVMEVMAFHPQ
jgi:hypothetical protein